MNQLWVYTIYHRPSDFTFEWVVRPSTVEGIGGVQQLPIACLCTTLIEARASVPRGMHCFARHPTDDPVIYECWL